MEDNRALSPPIVEFQLRLDYNGFIGEFVVSCEEKWLWIGKEIQKFVRCMLLECFFTTLHKLIVALGIDDHLKSKPLNKSL